ncbi:PH domain-containing protein, partial [Actinospica durhamensis]
MEPSRTAAEDPTRWYANGRRGASTTADPTGLTVRRRARRISVPWAEVAAISQERRERSGYLAGWIAVVRLNDGSALTELPGISTTDGTFSSETEAALATLTTYWRTSLTAPPPAPAPV